MPHVRELRAAVRGGPGPLCIQHPPLTTPETKRRRAKEAMEIPPPMALEVPYSAHRRPEGLFRL
jgi:hypothetical protein